MRKFDSVFWGLVVIAVGVIFLGNSLSFWNIDLFFDGWWTLFIIIPSIYGLFKQEWISSILGIVIGALLFLACQDYITWSMVGRLFFPILLILIGLSFIFKPRVKSVSVNKKGLPEYLGIFSGNDVVINDEFKGASLVSVFGGVELDLRDAKMDKEVVISAVSVFGGIDIKLPRNAKVKTSGIPIFGGVENKAVQEDGPTVIIDYVCIFGGIDIK